VRRQPHNPRHWTSLVLIPISWILLLLTGLISNDLIVSNIRTDVVQGSFELADYPAGRDGQSVRDQYTECIGVTMGINRNDPKDHLAPFRGYMLGNCSDLGLQISFPANQNPGFPTGSASEPNPYSRFWHGYQIVTRPFLALGGWDLLCACLAIALLLSTILLVRASSSREVQVALLILQCGLLIGLDIKSIISSPLVLISLTTTNVIAWLILRSSHQPAPTTQLMLSGYFLNFFLLLVNQGLIVIILTTICLIALSELNKPAILFQALTRSFSLLAVGWVLALLVRILFWRLWSPLGEIIESLRSTTISADLPALDGLNPAQKLQVATSTNFEYWRQSGYRSDLLEGLSIVGVVSLTSLLILRRDFLRLRTSLIHLAIILVSFASWFGMFATHSTLHAIFVWRAIPGLLASTLSICVLHLVRSRTHSTMDVSSASQFST
jgi:hypothetical protein